MKRPIGIIVLAALLAALIYSQRKMFFRSLAEEVAQQMGADTTAVAVDSVRAIAEPHGDPAAAAGSVRRGRAFLEAGDLDSAAVSFDRAQRLDPAAPAPLRHLAVVRAMQGRPGDALRALEGALARDSSDVWTWVQLGKMRAQLGQEQDARSAWARALALDPGNAAVQGLLEVTGPRAQRALRVALPAAAPADTGGVAE